MRRDHTPALDPRYWAALCGASVFGADCGDSLAHIIGLGHARGLPWLALAFALVLLAERRARRPGVAAYWAAIVLLRTAATNFADLMTHDWRLGYAATFAVLAVLFAVSIGARLRRTPFDGAVPAVDAVYWLTMGLAGTVGTVGGDALSGPLALGTGPATLVLLPAFVLALAAWRRAGALGYWLAVAVIRTIGTTFGDWSADGLGLGSATLVSGAVFLSLAASTHRGFAPAPPPKGSRPLETINRTERTASHLRKVRGIKLM